MFERADLLGHTEPDHYLWPACQWGRFDATQPMLKWDTAWRALRDQAGLPGLRFHDLRHTIITELAEMGVADHVLESISGHLSRRMLEHYSHIRIDAKRQALDALDNLRRGDDGAKGNGDEHPASEFTGVDGGASGERVAANGAAPSGAEPSPVTRAFRRAPDGAVRGQDPPRCGSTGELRKEIEAIVEVAGGLTSQSRHSLVLRGSPPAAKLLIPLKRRDVRVVEGARLESVCRRNPTVGSNPTLSANFRSRKTSRLPELRLASACKGVRRSDAGPVATAKAERPSARSSSSASSSPCSSRRPILCGPSARPQKRHAPDPVEVAARARETQFIRDASREAACRC